MVVESTLCTDIVGMGEELTMIIEDFDRAVNVESLRLAKRNGKVSSFNMGTVHSQ